MSKSKAVESIKGPKEENGKLIAEDGGEVTPALQEIYDFDKKSKETAVTKTYKNRTPAVINDKKGIVADMFNVPKVCEHCYLQDKCPHFDEDATCYFRVRVSVDTPHDMLNLLKMLIEMQGERIIMGRFIEQVEGGYMDKNLSDEIRRMLEMMKQFKDIMSSEEEISVKIKGKEAVKQAGGGILSEIFKPPTKATNAEVIDAEVIDAEVIDV